LRISVLDKPPASVNKGDFHSRTIKLLVSLKLAGTGMRKISYNHS
jgi:hypothetical protein